jgi:protein-S-isoprenylcysteine O-methyltransferase Ste14
VETVGPVTPAAPARLPRRAGLALAYGLVCHGLFAVAVLAMFFGMREGMTRGLGRLPVPLGLAADAALLLQFPLLHSFLLTRRGARWLDRLAPASVAPRLRTTTYAAVASLQTIALFVLWTPSGVVWVRAEGTLLLVVTVASLLAWLLLARAISDAGLALQTGFLGWRAVLRGEPARYPPMPEGGLFRVSRQPVYVAFALTTWTVPTWTPDQVAVAVTLTAYCVLGPLRKEARWRRTFGARFDAYRARVPYWLPWPRPR